ncbi:MAG: MFS transporter [Promethearchaeota archaeon]
MTLDKREKLSISLFLILIIIIVMDNALILPNEILIVAYLGISFATLGFLIGLYIIITGISVIIFGYLTDLVDRKNLLVLAGFLWAFSAILHIFIQNLWQLLFLRMIAAVATGVTTPVAFSYLSDVISSDSRSKAFAIWGLITTLGTILAGIFALSFNTINWSEIPNQYSEDLELLVIYLRESPKYNTQLGTWRMPFLYLGIIALIVTILNLLYAIEPKRAGKDKYLEEILANEDIQYSYRIKRSDLKYIFTRKSNFFLIMNFFDVVASGILLAYVFTYIFGEIGLSEKNPADLTKLLVLLLIAGPLGLVIGQLFFATLGDKRVQKGDNSGRVKVATTCSILHLPFLLFAFSMTPNARANEFFFGSLKVDDIGFWMLWILFAIFLGVGLAFIMGIGPNWYSSLIDVNMPEHRGTMIAMASFMDTIGRALGAVIGGVLITLTGKVSTTIFWATLIFGLISTSFWIPLFFTCEKDFNEIADIMKQRAEKLKKSQEIRKSNI